MANLWPSRDWWGTRPVPRGGDPWRPRHERPPRPESGTSIEDWAGTHPSRPDGEGEGEGDGGGPEWTYKSPPYGGPYRPRYSFDPVPEFDAPEFMAPSYEDALNEPGYRFRLDESLKGLQRSAAARGVLRGGGTLSGIVERAQNMAAAEYGNVWNRALQSHQETYKGARDEYLPSLLEWQTLTAAEQRAADMEWQRYWDAFVYGRDDEWRREHMVYTTPLG